MDQDPIIENEQDVVKQVEQPESQIDKGIEMLERPPGGDFISGLKGFIDWIQNLVGKKD